MLIILKKKRLLKLKCIFKNILKYIDDIFLIIGFTLMSTGVFKMYIPAGYIVLGICFIAFAFFIVKRGG